MKDWLDVLDKKGNPNQDKDNIADKKIFIFSEMASVVKHGDSQIYFIVEDFFVVGAFSVAPKQVYIPNMLSIFFIDRKRVMPPVVSVCIDFKNFRIQFLFLFTCSSLLELMIIIILEDSEFYMKNLHLGFSCFGVKSCCERKMYLYPIVMLPWPTPMSNLVRKRVYEP